MIFKNSVKYSAAFTHALSGLIHSYLKACLPCGYLLILKRLSILGKPLGWGVLTYCTPTLTLHVGCPHEKEISFLVLERSTADIILGCLWIQTHSPHIFWSIGDILSWSKHCFQNCLYFPTNQERIILKFLLTLPPSKAHSNSQSGDSLWVLGVPGCVQQTTGYQITTWPAMRLYHRAAAWSQLAQW